MRAWPPIVAALMIAAATGVGAFDLKGIEPGRSTVESVKSAFPGIRCGPNGDDFDECIYSKPGVVIEGFPDIEALDTVAGSNARHWFIHAHKGLVGKVEIAMNPGDFDQVSGALSEKFGRPARREGDIKTRMGAVYRQVVLTWHKGGQMLRLEKYSESIDLMTLLLIDYAYIKIENEAEARRQRKGAKDL